MKPDGIAKHFALAFLLALAAYVLVFWAIEHRRTRKGPWQVTFTTATTGVPALVVNQPWLGITNVQIHFLAQPALTNRAVTLSFREPRPVPYALPFGQCVFMDTTFLPGTVTMQLFNHEVELLPRVLTIDHQEHPWQPNAVLDLAPTPPLRSNPR